MDESDLYVKQAGQERRPRMKRMRMTDRSHEGRTKVWWTFYVDENRTKTRRTNRMEGIFVRGCCVHWLGFMEALILSREGIHGHNPFAEGTIAIATPMSSISYSCPLPAFLAPPACAALSPPDCVLFCVVCLLEKCARLVLVGFGLGLGRDWEYRHWVEGKPSLNGLD